MKNMEPANINYHPENSGNTSKDYCVTKLNNENERDSVDVRDVRIAAVYTLELCPFI